MSKKFGLEVGCRDMDISKEVMVSVVMSVLMSVMVLREIMIRVAWIEWMHIWGKMSMSSQSMLDLCVRAALMIRMVQDSFMTVLDCLV